MCHALVLLEPSLAAEGLRLAHVAYMCETVRRLVLGAAWCSASFFLDSKVSAHCPQGNLTLQVLRCTRYANRLGCISPHTAQRVGTAVDAMGGEGAALFTLVGENSCGWMHARQKYTTADDTTTAAAAADNYANPF